MVKDNFMNILIQTLSIVIVVVIPVIVSGIRIEHRLTKIETDVSWLKTKLDCKDNPNCEGNKK